jgi:hypothetical protein
VLKTNIKKKPILIKSFLVSKTGLGFSLKYLTIMTNANIAIGQALNLSGTKIVALFR